ncbi:MAG: UDP-N-acetylmuramoyl-L-alanyl-D-glutamate--2,6-diaminopimelate ligase [Aeriscardovia sp.]|nr:UDP-N-acetylmuramoyl-L-alanyl-D-glutamate--2,6-diaminopimelate ligase [Aeriscardovia sp.]
MGLVVQKKETIRNIVRLLKEKGLLREVIFQDEWSSNEEDVPEFEIDALSYSSKNSSPSTLLFCKGAFKEEYLKDSQSLFYVSTRPYPSSPATAIVVQDAAKAMAEVGAYFYSYPQEKMCLAAVTGTKGKTTTAFFTHAILSAHFGSCGLLSSDKNCSDGVNFTPSSLTTPESLDIFKALSDSLFCGVGHFVMEVSSQAYKVSRVEGIKFDAGAFLNISPDHVSPSEHPNFEDYFFCKRQLVKNSRGTVYSADLGKFEGIIEEEALKKSQSLSFSLSSASSDLYLKRTEKGSEIFFEGKSLGAFNLAMEGDFNLANAMAAIGLAIECGVPEDSPALHALEKVKVSGRMERLDPAPGVTVYVDYAHNYLSLASLIRHVQSAFKDPFITVVTGATGTKGLNRREGLGRAASLGAGRLILTTDDRDFDSLDEIDAQIEKAVDNPDTKVEREDDRTLAVLSALNGARAGFEKTGRQNVVLLVGKGDEDWVKVAGKKVPQKSDPDIVKEWSKEIS